MQKYLLHPNKVRIIVVVVACCVEDMNGIWNLSFLNLVQMIWSFQKQIESRNIHAFWKLQKILWDLKIKIFNISEHLLNARQYSTGFTYSKFFSPQNSHMRIFNCHPLFTDEETEPETNDRFWVLPEAQQNYGRN